MYSPIYLIMHVYFLSLMGVVSFILVHPDRRATRGRKQTFMHIKNLFYAWLWQLKIVHLKEPIDGHELPPKTCDSSDYNVLTYIFTLIRKVNSIRSCRSVGTYMTVNKPEPPQFPNKTKLYLKRVLLNLFHSWRALTFTQQYPLRPLSRISTLHLS